MSWPDYDNSLDPSEDDIPDFDCLTPRPGTPIFSLFSNTPNVPNLPPGRVILPPQPEGLSINQLLRHQRSQARLLSKPEPYSTPSFYPPPNLKEKIAPLQVDFIIVGGGLAGFACGFELARHGHRIHVLEQTSAETKRVGGVRVPPNLSKILMEWGLEKELEREPRCRKSAFHSADTGKYIGFLEWQEQVIRETGGEFLLMAYDDLYEKIRALADSVGVRISYDTKITSVGFDDMEGKPYVTLQDGSTLHADVVIGADGPNSMVREYVGGMEEPAMDDGHSFLTFTIPSDVMRHHPTLGKWVDMQAWPIWMGSSRSVLGYPIRGGKEYCFNIYWPDAELLHPEKQEGWDHILPSEILDLTNFDQGLQAITKMTPTCIRTKVLDRLPLEDWVDETGRVLLIGEAAHPILPCSTHNASLAVEDAVVLGVLMSRLRSPHQIPQYLEGFQEIRQGRCRHVRLSELHNAALCTLPPGEDREIRDTAMALSLMTVQEGEWDDSRLRAQYEEIGEVFGYNAREAAEDWWIQWGALGDVKAAAECHSAITMNCFSSAVTRVEIS